MTVTVRPVGLETIFPLRHRVLRAGLPEAAARYERDEAAEAVHFGAFGEATGGEATGGGAAGGGATNVGSAPPLLGCVTIHHDPLNGDPAWRLRGMAVAGAAQGLGVGRRLLDAVDAHVRAAGGPAVLWCNARLPAVGFYARCGWDAVGGVFAIPGVGPHRLMVRREV